MGKKIARIAGSVVCAVLFAACVLMLVLSFVFGAEGLVGIFGYNVYISETSYYDSVPYGSAVIVESCEPYELENGNLVLYYQKGENDLLDENMTPVLGYAGEISTVDGIYYIAVSGEGGDVSVAENHLVGRCHWSSEPLGKVIGFVNTPLGVCLIAVLPCLAFIIFELTRRYEELQVPEVQPVVKNPEENKPEPRFSVNNDGKASYSRYGSRAGGGNANSVLFSLNSDSSRGDIFGSRKPVEKSAPPAEAPAPKAAPAADSAAEIKAKTPPSVAAKRYLDNAVNDPVSSKTSELPQIQPKKKNDAFFTQSTAPQIGRKPTAGSAAKGDSRSVIDLEETLATSRKGATGKRSNEILAQKSRSDIIADDSAAEDAIDRGRYEVDDILAGISNRRRP